MPLGNLEYKAAQLLSQMKKDYIDASIYRFDTEIVLQEKSPDLGE